MKCLDAFRYSRCGVKWNKRNEKKLPKCSANLVRFILICSDFFLFRLKSCVGNFYYTKLEYFSLLFLFLLTPFNVRTGGSEAFIFPLDKSTAARRKKRKTKHDSLSKHDINYPRKIVTRWIYFRSAFNIDILHPFSLAITYFYQKLRNKNTQIFATNGNYYKQQQTFFFLCNWQIYSLLLPSNPCSFHNNKMICSFRYEEGS